MEDLAAVSAKVNSNMNEELPDKQSEAASSFSAHISVQIESSVESESTQQQILHRVPQQLKDKNEGIYEPVVLSLGPYHNIKSQQMEELKNYEMLSNVLDPSLQRFFRRKTNQIKLDQFRRVEEFKDEVVDIMLEPGVKEVFRSKILERVDEIRIFYGGVSREEHDDDALAEMMLRDACFLLYYVQDNSFDHFVDSLGLSIVAFLARDFFMLENQIPLWVIKLLFTLKSEDKDEGEKLIRGFLDFINFWGVKLTELPWEGEEEEPPHLLEAVRSALVKENTNNSTTKHSKVRSIFKSIEWRLRKSDETNSEFEMLSSPFRSVTDLKAKGIHFKPSSYCLKDIRFNSHTFYAVLKIPTWFVTNNTKVLFSNLIAFEMSPKTDTDLGVLSYVNFMKSLIDCPKDVKELREKGILFSSLRNDEEVVKIFKEIDTYGMDNDETFQDIKMRINKHCNSKSRTWMVELTHTYFRSPWPATALLASVFLLCLTFIQTYYAIHPQKDNS